MTRAQKVGRFCIALFLAAGCACSVAAAATAPVFTSPPSVDNNVAYAGQTLTFTAAATSSNGKPIVYTWNFGDGTTASGASVTHIFVTPAASLNVQVTASDGTLSTSAFVTVTINAPIFGTGLDSDGDGFSDEFELEAGTDPNDAASTPLNGIPAFSFEEGAIQIPTLKVTYKVGTPSKVTVSMTGAMLFGAVMPPHRPEHVYVVIESADGKAGFGRSYVLDSKGTGGTSPTGSIKYSPGSFGTAQRPVPRKARTLRYHQHDDEDDEDDHGHISHWGHHMHHDDDTRNERLTGATGNTAVTGVTGQATMYATYGGNVFMQTLTVVVTEDSKGNFTATSKKP